MAFNSIQFLVFFPIVVILYFSVPGKFRWCWLLAASYFFYMSWRPEYLLLIIASTLVDYFCGMAISRSQKLSRRKLFLLVSLGVNLGLLFAFKYFNFFNGVLKELFLRLNWPYRIADFDVLLPVGISFYTFQTLSYTIEVYQRKKKPETHLGFFALYVAFFPQLVAGPIERAQNLLPQLKRNYAFEYARVTNGLRLMLWGMFKKVVIADRLAIVVNRVYDQPADYHGWGLCAATIFFAFQIYCDFSGYSDIAIGAARVMGIHLMKNFDRPYLASSIREFWGRWHISLSTWFRDYVYIPLGGNHCRRSRWQWNILTTFVLSGLWHGANWTFIVWGGLHGFYYLFSRWTADARLKLVKKFSLDRHPFLLHFFRVVLTFSLVCFSWIFFRANSLYDAFYIVSHLGAGLDRPLIFHAGQTGYIGLPLPDFIFSCFLILFLLAVQVMQGFGPVQHRLTQQTVWLRWAVYVSLALMIMNLGISEEIPFIYFQF